MGRRVGGLHLTRVQRMGRQWWAVLNTCTENGQTVVGRTQHVYREQATGDGLYLTRVQRMGDRWRTVINPCTENWQTVGRTAPNTCTENGQTGGRTALNTCTENGQTGGVLYLTRVQRMGDRWRMYLTR